MDKNHLRPRVGRVPLAVGVVLVVVGVVLPRFFNYRLGTVLIVVGAMTVIYSLVLGRDRRVIAATVLALALFGVTWATANRDRDPPEPPSMDTVVSDASEYVRSLAEGDFGAYSDMVDQVLGVTVEEAFRIESGCIDWNSATVTVEPNDISPTVAYVTFFDGASSVTRDFLFVSGHWVPTVDDGC